MFKSNWVNERQLKRKKRVGKKLNGTADKPRLSVFRSNKYIYVQAIDDVKGQTLASSSSLTLYKGKKETKLNKEVVAKVGADIAKKLLEKNITTVVFDRNGYLYTGKIQALADSAREAGLKF
ncbi:MAG: 50S ribosomal protein L18 [Spirochaetales bacterium]|nr:50S ribosomal protein L18 [Spirochaetales bacterium]